jgi:hypothetical protein
MPATTPISGLPYPLPTEPVAEGAQAIRNLAEAIDGLPRRIAAITLAAPAPSFDFQSIPQTPFEHLRLIVDARSDVAATETGLNLRFNNDASALYDWQITQTSGAGAAGAVSSLDTKIIVGNVPGAAVSAGFFSLTEILIGRYRGPHNKHTLAHSALIHDQASKIIFSGAGDWRNQAAAINRVTVYPNTGQFIAGSQAILYGLP